ncbi:tail fiber assembly protein [Gilliamella sp. W8126]|uniref:tail fiber assembly protein n=1 Tax=Gilliamella sp. W8126 TaxID=2750946 RepID=UPI0018DCFAE8|nr:tail fiber assembly protein [Gilliamella sp. W8126]MBI0004923.1 tail fiber assembly protein [Gilliamella sp. W8126]
MKYQLQPETAVLDSNGLTVSAGWTVVYNVDAKGEFLQATYQYLPVGVGLPANAYLDAPKSVKDNQAIIHNGQQWTYPKDLRGTMIYSTETGAETTMQEVGEIPAGYTTSKPNSEFDSWDGEKWVLDTEKQHQHNVDIATSQKKQLLSEATSQISYLQDAVDSQIATEQEIQLLAEWKKYRALVNRIDAQQAPNIDWPSKPSL